MAEMSVAVLAKRLAVTQRRAGQVVAAGQISARRTDSGEWLVDADSAEAYIRRRRTSRGLSSQAAWALLFILAGHRADWISASTQARLKRRIRTHSAETIARQVAGRTQAHRYRAANMDLAGRGLLLTGRSAVEAVDTDLLSDHRRLFGYVPAETTVDEWAADHFMIADPAGNAFLFTNTIPSEAATGTIPSSVVAADLAISADARERAAGVDALERMRTAWVKQNE